MLEQGIGQGRDEIEEVAIAPEEFPEMGRHGVAGHHFEHVDQNAVPEFSKMGILESLPVVLKNCFQPDFSTYEFHECSFESETLQGKEKVAAKAAIHA